jgi:hypothetical protein
MDGPAARRRDWRRGYSLIFREPPEGAYSKPRLREDGRHSQGEGFPPEAWFEEGLGDGVPSVPTEEGRGIAGMVEHLLDAVRNPNTGEPYTNAEVARMTLGDLSEADVEGIRAGAISDPTASQVAALAGVFGVEPSYLLDRGEAPFDGGLVEALRDGTVREAALEISRLSERERRLVLGIVRQFGKPGMSSEVR